MNMHQGKSWQVATLAILVGWCGVGLGTDVVPSREVTQYPGNRPTAKYRLEAKDQGVVFKHGNGPDKCDYLGARDLWIYEDKGTYYMHYDGSGPKGWLACLATSKDLVNWTAKGSVIDFGDKGTADSASASYGTTYFDGKIWHMFYLGTPHASPSPHLVPSPPYLTMKAQSKSPSGPWVKQYDVTPFRPSDVSAANYKASSVVVASPGMIVKNNDEYMMFFSGGGYSAQGQGPYGHISIARTKDLNGKWTVDSQPMLPWNETCENSSLYFEQKNKTWFLFTNHIDRDHTDAVWVYWTKDLNKWNAENKAVVFDKNNCTWAKRDIGLPGVIKVGDRLAVLYDAGDEPGGMRRDIGLAWLDLPLVPPAEKPAGDSSTSPAGYTYCAKEGESFTLSGTNDVAFGVEGKFAYVFNQTGTITFTSEFFGQDPAPGAVKAGFYKRSGPPADPLGVLRKPIPDKLVVLTFDDACVTHATFVAPLLKSMGFGGSFYICTFPTFTNKKWYMSWEQMKEMVKDGFEIGNHTRHHVNGAGIGEFLDMEKEMIKHGLPKPITEAWPSYIPNTNAFSALASNKYIFARGGHFRPYRPTVDNPFDIPSVNPKNMKTFTRDVQQAANGCIVVITYHGVPDYEHDFAGTKPEIFKQMMQYLKDNNYKVIGLRDLAEYIDTAKAAKLPPTK